GSLYLTRRFGEILPPYGRACPTLTLRRPAACTISVPAGRAAIGSAWRYNPSRSNLYPGRADKVSYVLFLILFLCVPVAALAYLMHGSIRRVHVTMLAGIATLTVVYTSPWDNYLVATRVWHYAPELILNLQIAYVPVEVY